MKKISKKNLTELNKLVSTDKIRKVIQILRDPDGGCPWDLKQDYNSLAPYSIEEAYELVNAIEKNNVKEIKNELGDLLLILWVTIPPEITILTASSTFIFI